MIDEYNSLVDNIENLGFLLFASKRTIKNHKMHYIEYEDVLAEFNITAEEVAKLQDSIELD